MDQERLKTYKSLAQRGLWDIKDEGFKSFFARAQQEDVDLVSNNFSTLGMFRAPHRKSTEGVDLAIVGVPLDLGVPNPRPGTRLAPREIRYWSLDRNMAHYATKIVPFDLCSIIDWGDVAFTQDPYNLNACLNQLYDIYLHFQQSEIMPFTIGGEHTITYSILKALSTDEPLGVIHLDAHADTSVNFGGTTVSDASLFQVATVEGFIDPERTIQIGLRGRGVVRSDFSRESGMRMIFIEDFMEMGLLEVIEEARKIVGDKPCYLSIDTDVFDCSVMPGTTLPEPFGLSGIQVRDIIRGLRGLNLKGADLVELSPVYDPTGMSACLASGIAFEMLCLLAESKAKQNHFERKTHWK